MTILFQPAPEGTTHFLRFASGHVVWCKVEQGVNNQLILKEWDSSNEYWVPGIRPVEHYQEAGLMTIDDFPGEVASPAPDNAPTGATHYYSHGGEVSWYRETENGLSVWRDGSWYASTYKTALDLAKVCPLGAVSTFGEEKQPEQAEDDLTWLARDVHVWPFGRQDFIYVITTGDDKSWGGQVFLCKDPFSKFTKDQWLARRAELQNKPTWADAPEWAEWLAQDSDGVWWFHRCEPKTALLVWRGTDRHYANDGEVLGDWRDTLERRPADLSEPAVTERLTEAAQTVLAAAPALMDEKFRFDPVSTAEADTLAKTLCSLLKTDAWGFDSNALAELHQLCDAELTKRDAAVCGGQKYIDAHWFERGELPPVGVVCEAYIDYPPQWVEAEIVAHKDGFAIGWCKSVMKGCHGDKASEFRPIHTARDELVNVFINHYGNPKGAEGYIGIADAILAAGFKREGGKI